MEKYNVIWDTQSKDSSASMPVGGGDVGLNVWVEDDALYFYIGKTDTFDENNMLAKLGRVKMTLSENPFKNGCVFKQELRLREGYCIITATGNDGNEVTITIWVDVYTSTIHVELTSIKPILATVEYQSWRYEDRFIEKVEGFDQYIDFARGYPKSVIEHADHMEFRDGGILYYHKNDNTDLAMNKAIAQMQLLEIDRATWFDPQTDFIFGGFMRGEQMVPAGETKGSYHQVGDRGDYRGWVLKSDQPVNHEHIQIQVHTGQFADSEQWYSELRSKTGRPHEESISWWHDFWGRSHITINSGTDMNDIGWQVARNYALFRYMEGCNAFGKYPEKFNGGMFTWDYEGNPDYRRWGGSTMTAQNQRHIYWPLLKSGDYELMIPQFDFYNRSYKNNEQVTRLTWGHGGTKFDEYPTHYGLNAICLYGWTEEARQGFEKGVTCEPYTCYEYVHQLDFAKMILDYHTYSGEAIDQYVGFIESAVLFFLEHYKYQYKKYNPKSEDGFDAHGKLVIYPSTAVETYKNALNPTDVIDALQSVCEGLIDLKEEGYLVNDGLWQEMLSRLPKKKIEGDTVAKQVFKPAYHPGQRGQEHLVYQRPDYYTFNIEIPQLSAVYPYNKISLGQDQGMVQIGINTWNTELNEQQKGYVSWHYGNIVTARLGLAEEAKALTVKKLSNSDRRFPAFWGPGHDWTPDHNWGGTAMMGLQEMALQAFDETILPYPCWPSEWKGTFKLHAPFNTVVEAAIEAGELQGMRVIINANSRRKQVIVRYPKVSQVMEVFKANGEEVAFARIDDDTMAFAIEADTTYDFISRK